MSAAGAPETGHGPAPPDVGSTFEEFAAASANRLAQLATLLSDDASTADDLVQHTLTKTFLAWRRVHSDPFAYARRIMLNRRTDLWRLRREHTRDMPPDVVADTDVAEAVAAQVMVVRALRALPMRDRRVVVLRYFEDLTGAQIAEELNIPLGTVKTILSRSLAKLRVSPDIVADQPLPTRHDAKERL